MKILGAALVFLASLLGGWGARRGMQRQLRLLYGLRMGLERLQGELETRLPGTAELLHTLGENLPEPLGPVFHSAGGQMEEVPGRPPQTALRIALEEAGSPLGPEDAGLLLELAASLGRLDPERMDRALEPFRGRLDRRIGQMEADLRHRARASLTAAVCGAAALIVMLW